MAADSRAQRTDLVSIESTPSLWWLLLKLAETRLAEIRERDGGGRAPATPGLQALLGELRMSANGRAVATLETRVSAAASFLTASQAADVIGCTVRHARRLASAGILRSRRHGRIHMIERASAEDYRKERDRERGSTGTATDRSSRKGRRRGA